MAFNHLNTGQYCGEGHSLKDLLHIMVKYNIWNLTPKQHSTKLCKKCNIEKSSDDFGKTNLKKDGLQTFCKICASEISKRYYKDNNKKDLYSKRAQRRRGEISTIIHFIKSKYKCAFCEEGEPVCLDFHHTKDKEFELSSPSLNKAIPKLIAEINKCEILCSNCHRKVHANILTILRPRKFDLSVFDDFIINKNKRTLKPKQFNFCIDCNLEISRGPWQRCRKCAASARTRGSYLKKEKITKVYKERPVKFIISQELLQQLIWQKPTIEIAKIYGVSDKAVEKRCKKYNISKPPRGYWQKLKANLTKQSTT